MTVNISQSGPTISFTDPIPAVQKYVDELQAKGINRIIALSHHGYTEDMKVAAKTRGVDLIVGGHSHSYLGDSSNPLSKGPYPTVVKDLNGDNTLIVQVIQNLPSFSVLFSQTGPLTTSGFLCFYHLPRHSAGVVILAIWTLYLIQKERLLPGKEGLSWSNTLSQEILSF